MIKHLAVALAGAALLVSPAVMADNTHASAPTSVAPRYSPQPVVPHVVIHNNRGSLSTFGGGAASAPRSSPATMRKDHR
jgi:hypothetical protein